MCIWAQNAKDDRRALLSKEWNGENKVINGRWYNFLHRKPKETIYKSLEKTGKFRKTDGYKIDI